MLVEFLGAAESVLAALVLQPGADGQALEPGTESLGLAQARDTAPGLQEGLLRQVVGQRGIAAEAPHQVADPGLAPPDQLGKGVPVAGPGQADDQGFGCLGVFGPGVIGLRGGHEFAA